MDQKNLDGINEGMISNVVDVLRYNLEVNDIGIAVIFRFKFPFSKTKLELRLKKDTLFKVFDYMDEIKKQIKYKNK